MKTFFFICMLLVSTLGMAQDVKLDTLESDSIPAGEMVYFTPDKLPEYKGGASALQKFLQDHLKYPSVAQQKQVHGLIVVRFIVELDGTTSHFEVVRKKLNSDSEIIPDADWLMTAKKKNVITRSDFAVSQQLLEEEAVRVCTLLNKWKAGVKDGENVRVYMSLPITFRLRK